jgi:hypothetical protein
MKRRAPTSALILRPAAGFSAALAIITCGGDTANVPADVMDRETFIATYVDLREAAIASSDFRITEGQRTAILARHGVDGESLLRFADVHGRDLDYMNAVWTEVDARLAEPPPDGEAAQEPPPR